MRRRFASVVLMLWSVVPAALAQDPMTVAPNAYKVQFENEWVRVVRVHYGPHEKIAAHDHPTGGTVFVYLRDGGPVRFAHVDEEPYALERPATRARGYRVARPVNEHHEVENLSDLPSDFLRVEMKTAPVDVEASRGRFPPPETANASSEKVELNSQWLRTDRVTCAAGATYEVKGAATPSLLVAFGPVEVSTGKTAHKLGLGDTLWLEPGGNERIKNAGAAPVEVLRIELKSKPSSDWSPAPKAHDHH